MTYIPGTGSITVKNPEDPNTKNAAKTNIFSIVNVEKLKKPDEIEENDIEETMWFYQLKYWVIFGSVPSLFFALFAIFKWQFLFLIPIGPYALYLAWHIRKKIKKQVKKFDVLS